MFANVGQPQADFYVNGITAPVLISLAPSPRIPGTNGPGTSRS